METFLRRFGVDEAYGMLNMTETSSMLLQSPKLGSIGRSVGDHDIEVPVGTIGELVVRTDLPAGVEPRLPRDARRHHRGLAQRLVPHGRPGQLLRRPQEGLDQNQRGERLSFEVEREIVAHPAVEACAVVAAEPDGDEQILAAIAPSPGAELHPADVIDHLHPRHAYFMIPRFIEVTDRLPRTTDPERSTPRTLIDQLLSTAKSTNITASPIPHSTPN